MIVSMLYVVSACKNDEIQLSGQLKKDEQKDSLFDADPVLLDDPDSLMLVPPVKNNPHVPVIKIANIVNGGELSGATLVGSCLDSDGIGSVEIKIDEEPYLGADGTVEWSFRLPRGRASWKQGEVHTVSVRCHDLADNFALSSNVVFRQGLRRDINGDGFPDLVVGAPSASVSRPDEDGKRYEAAGRVYILFGKAQGLVTPASAAETTDAMINGEGSFWRLGSAIALGDFDADGYADIVAAEPGYDGGKGRVVIVKGRRDLRAVGNVADFEAQSIYGHSSTGSLGGSLVVANMNGDSFDDLIVAQSSSPGRLFVFLGSEEGLGEGAEKLTTRDAETTLIGSSSRFGGMLLPYDLDRDGMMDLVVGEPGAAAGGRVWIFSGTLSGLNRTPRHILTLTDDHGLIFGEHIAIGDFNSDRAADLAISASPSKPEGHKGRVVVISAKTVAQVDEFDVGQAMAERRVVVLQGKADSRFGASLAAADIDRNGVSDLLVGAPEHDGGRGRVYLFAGDTAFFTKKISTKQRVTAHFSGLDPDENFGAAIRVGPDFNSDGQPDLIFGSPRASSTDLVRRGRVYALYSEIGGFTAHANIGAIADAILEGEVAHLSLGEALP